MNQALRTMIQTSRRWGENFGERMACHNAFLKKDISPTTFGLDVARNLAMLETLMIVPTFASSVVHYFSAFGVHAHRTQASYALLKQCSRRGSVQDDLFKYLAMMDATTQLALRAFLLTTQLLLFPFWLGVAAINPAFVHGMMSRCSEVAADRYRTLQNQPDFAKSTVEPLLEARNVHASMADTEPDVIVCVIVLLLLYYFLH